jgi:hypothetical protein
MDCLSFIRGDVTVGSCACPAGLADKPQQNACIECYAWLTQTLFDNIGQANAMAMDLQ